MLLNYRNVDRRCLGLLNSPLVGRSFFLLHLGSVLAYLHKDIKTELQNPTGRAIKMKDAFQRFLWKNKSYGTSEWKKRFFAKVYQDITERKQQVLVEASLMILKAISNVCCVNKGRTENVYHNSRLHNE